MRIGIDISQIVYEGTGVATYVRDLVRSLLTVDRKNEYILFGASFRKKRVFEAYYRSLAPDTHRVKLRTYPIPPTVLDILWNRLHICPIEWFIGEVDVFWSSDWTQPPLAKARGITTIHDLGVLLFPHSFHRKILSVQKRRLQRALRECSTFLCDSNATKNDVVNLLKIDKEKVQVVYPGFSASLI